MDAVTQRSYAVSVTRVHRCDVRFVSKCFQHRSNATWALALGFQRKPRILRGLVRARDLQLGKPPGPTPGAFENYACEVTFVFSNRLHMFYFPSKATASLHKLTLRL